MKLVFEVECTGTSNDLLVAPDEVTALGNAVFRMNANSDPETLIRCADLMVRHAQLKEKNRERFYDYGDDPALFTTKE